MTRKQQTHNHPPDADCAIDELSVAGHLDEQTLNWFAKHGAAGGRKAAKGMTKKQRSARAKKASTVRWAAAKRKGNGHE
jgi:hypothetical protein